MSTTTLLPRDFISASSDTTFDLNRTDLTNHTKDFTNYTNNFTMTTKDGGDGDDDGAIYFKILLILATYFYPIVVIGGIFCNVLSIMVMQSASMRNISINVYLTALAVTDSLVLLLDFINNYLKQVVGVNALTVSHFLCGLYRFSFDVVFTMSAWLVVAITVERLIIVWFPLKVKSFISVKKASLVSVGIFLVICIYKLYNFWAWKVRDGACDWNSGWEDFHMNLNMPLTFAAYSYIPLVILVACNTSIAVNLWRQLRRREDMMTTSNSSDNSTRRLTITVLVISTAYLVLTVPLSAYYTIQYADQQFIDMTPQMAMGEMIILLVGLSNHSINFFLYIISSRSFRKVLISMLHAEKFCGGSKRVERRYKQDTDSSSQVKTNSAATKTDGGQHSQSTLANSTAGSQSKEASSLDEVEMVVNPAV